MDEGLIRRWAWFLEIKLWAYERRTEHRRSGDPLLGAPKAQVARCPIRIPIRVARVLVSRADQWGFITRALVDVPARSR